MNENNVDSKIALLEHIKICEEGFIQLIRRRLGIIIHKHQTSDLHKTLVEACDKFKCSIEDYLQMISTCPNDSPLLEHLVYGITIGETYFFRDSNHMLLLQDRLLPALIKAKRQRGDLSLRIWSAGSSTGEEIYTIAMMLLEMLPDSKSWTFQLIGTDINTSSLKKAINGHYNEWSMRSISEYYKKKYCNYSPQSVVESAIMVGKLHLSWIREKMLSKKHFG